MLNVIAQELPPLRMASLYIDLLQFFIDDVESLDRSQLVAESRQPQVGARRDERVDLRRGEVLEQAGYEVVEAVKRQGLSSEQGLKVGQAIDVDGDLDAF